MSGISTLPPFGISCRDPAKWRNRHCPMSEAAEMGTELDWMVFLWNLNTRPDHPTTMTDLWRIYRHACHPAPAGQAPPVEPALCRGGEELSWRARPVVDLSPPRACLFNTANSCLRGERCRSATAGSDAPCTSSSPSCVCKLPAVGGFLNGVRAAFAGDDDRIQDIEDLADLTGISRNLTP
jgi:hypothetical protein